MKLFIICLIFLSCATNPKVRIETEFGNVDLELFNDKAPVTTQNFLAYVDSGHYNESNFYRSVTMANQPNNEIKIEVIQGGIWPKQPFKPIRHESTKETGVLHLDGVISMARSDTGTVTAEFFICVGDQAELDFAGKRNPDGQGFAAFGQVINGMEVVHKIHQSVADTTQQLEPKILIKNIRRLNE